VEPYARALKNIDGDGALCGGKQLRDEPEDHCGVQQGRVQEGRVRGNPSRHEQYHNSGRPAWWKKCPAD